MNSLFTSASALAVGFFMASFTNAHAVAVVFSAAGSDSASIQPTVDSFRAALGALNPNTPGSLGDGRREINWDGVPQSASSPNPFPSDFFNANTAGRARGVEFSTPGTEFRVSANSGVGPVEFGELDPLYPTLFAPFSSQKLFTAVGSTITDVNFFVPGSGVAATTDGFGVVFSDVDLANTTSLQFFDANGGALGTYFASPSVGTETFAFLGVSFDDAVVGRVRITSGNQILAPGSVGSDLVVMDDLIYGEPRQVRQASPVPDVGATLGFLCLSLCGLICLQTGASAASRRAGGLPLRG